MPIWISHRGYAKRYTENSMGAFNDALEVGFRNLEADLQLSKDKKIVLSHDLDFKSVLGEEISIPENSFREIRFIQLPCGERPALFEDFFEAFKDYGLTLDIKEPYGQSILEQLRKFSELKHKDNLRFVIWKESHRNWLSEYFPKAEVYAGYRSCQMAGLLYLTHLKFLKRPTQGLTYSVPPRWMGRELFRPELVDYFHSHGARILAFLPETSADTQSALDCGFDEILSNHPPLLSH